MQAKKAQKDELKARLVCMNCFR